MPPAFEHCIKSGGRVRRITPKPGAYLNVCFLGGKSYAGHVHHTGRTVPTKHHMRGMTRK